MPLLGSSFDSPTPCVVYALMEEGSLEDRLACRAARGGGAALKPLSAAERVCVLSDVARGEQPATGTRVFRLLPGIATAHS